MDTRAGRNGGRWTVRGRPGRRPATVPPETIPASGSASWSESNGVLTGTRGRVVYWAGHGHVEIHRNNPYFGGNTYDCRVPSGHGCRRLGGPGNNASVTFEVPWV